MLVGNGDEIHLLVEDAETGILASEEIGMIFVVLLDLSIRPAEVVAREVSKVIEAATVEKAHEDLEPAHKDQPESQSDAVVKLV